MREAMGPSASSSCNNGQPASTDKELTGKTEAGFVLREGQKISPGG